MTSSANYIAEADKRAIDINYSVEIAGVSTVFTKKAISGLGGSQEPSIVSMKWNPPKLTLDNPKVSIGTIDVKLIDPNGTIRAALAAGSLHLKKITLKRGFTNLDTADYNILSEFNIYNYSSKDGVTYHFKGRDRLAELNSPIFYTKTTLTSILTDIASTAAVADTTDFPASGTIFIDDERIDYSSKSALAFNGLTRGSDPEEHKIGADVFIFESVSENPVTYLLQRMISDGGGGIYDVLDFGLGIDETTINLQSFVDVRDNSTLAGVIWRFDVRDDIDNVMQFFEREIFQFSNIRLFVDDEGKIACSLFQEITLDQFSGDLIREDVVGLPTGDSNSDRVVNQFLHKFDYDEETKKYSREKTHDDTDSQAKFGIRKGKTLSSKHIRAGLDGDSQSTQFANRYFRRVAEPFNLIKKVKTLWKKQFFKAGDKTQFVHNQVLDIFQGTIGIDNLVEIISSKYDFDKGLCTYEINNAPFLNNRFGFISPASPIASGASNTIFTLATGEAVRGDWEENWVIHIYNLDDGLKASGPHTITDITGEVITVSPSMSLTPDSTHGMRFGDYDEVDGAQKIYGFITDDELPFPSDGGDPYRIS